MSDQTPRRPRAQSKKRTAVEKIKRSFSVSVRASERVDAEALGLRIDPGELVDSLILAHCRTFYLTARRGHADSPIEGEAHSPARPGQAPESNPPDIA